MHKKYGIKKILLRSAAHIFAEIPDHKWRPTVPNEIKSFVGVIDRLPTFRMYWSKKKPFETNICFRKTFPLARFERLLKLMMKKGMMKFQGRDSMKLYMPAKSIKCHKD